MNTHLIETMAREWLQTVMKTRKLNKHEISAVLNFAVWMDMFLAEEKAGKN